MIEALALALLGAAFGAALLFYRQESMAWRVERADLLNRLMVKDWTEYRAMIQPQTRTVVPSFATDEEEAAWWTAKQREAA